MLVSIATSSEKDEQELKQFIQTHPSVKVIDPAFAHQYDEYGNFKVIDLHLPGPPVSNEYMEWYLETTMDENEPCLTEAEFTNWYNQKKKQLTALSNDKPKS